MKFHAPRLRRRFAVLGLAALAACGGADEPADDASGATPEDVDQEASATVTEEELAKFRAPADSVLTPKQVEAYIRTSLLQFDLVNKESARLHAKVEKMEERGKDGGVLSGFRNLTEGMATMGQAADLIGGSFVRSARTLGYNPAEMEWVRERMGDVTGYLVAKPILQGQADMAKSIRQQVEEARRAGPASGYSEEMLRQMLANADEMERTALQNTEIARATLRNYEVLRSTRSNVTDPMWLAVGMAGGASGLLSLSGLGDPQDTTVQRQLGEYRRVFTDALDNKVSQGMENTPAQAEATS
ncbi:MAG TPA: hypothetical protein VHG91_01210 [Longimicrobium sp.]|nr:hypothetical protein [Longimicrobium sp.]